MDKITITEIFDGLRAAHEITRRFKRRYWLSSADFYELNQSGQLDNGEPLEEFTLWAAYYKIKRERESDLQTLWRVRLEHLRRKKNGKLQELETSEPTLQST